MSDKQTSSPVALEMAGRQRDISVSEFFLKNRHLLGFDTPSKALVTAVKESVDNALDACEEAEILPDLFIEIREHSGKAHVVVEDNGPGIVENQIARIFGKLLYGSKFHKLSQSRGQQGMGISAAGMYAQLTVGKPIHILSRIDGEELASELHVSIDTANNRPDIHRKRHVPWDRPHGTRVELTLEGHHIKGPHSVDTYLMLTAIANPHVSITYRNTRGELTQFLRSTSELPPRPVEIKPHPHGIELGRLIQMLQNTKSRSLQHFLIDEFSGVGSKTAAEIIHQAGKSLSAKSYPTHIAHAQATALHEAIKRTRVRAPRTDCIVPIGEIFLLEGLRKEVDAEFIHVVTRPASVYRGNPFQIEVGIAYGRHIATALEDGEKKRTHKTDAARVKLAADLISGKDEPVRILRYANRVPLLFQQSSCAITKSVQQTNWRTYGLSQPKGGLPVAPMAIVAHVASVWVPYTSESKEAIEAYPEILKELKLGMQECARHLAHHLRQKMLLNQERGRRSYIERYLPHIGTALKEILSLSDEERDAAIERLDEILKESRTTRRSPQ